MMTTASHPEEPAAVAALSTILQLIEDYHDFYPGPIPVYPYPTPLQFSKQVSRGRPCVYRLLRDWHDSDDSDDADNAEEEQHAILDAPAFKWTKESLGDLVSGDVEVAVTPDGRADSLYSLPRRLRRTLGSTRDGGSHAMNGDGRRDRGDDSLLADEKDEDEEEDEDEEQVFVQPATMTMPLSTLLDTLSLPPPPPPSTSSSLNTTHPPKMIHYLQSQNSNLSTPPLNALTAHIPPPPSFATTALGVQPEATNIWIGTGESVTSTHRDPYENLYLVVKGRKRFTLYAPVEEVCLHAEMVRTGRWVVSRRRSGGEDGDKKGEEEGEWEWKIVLDDEEEDRDQEGTVEGRSPATQSSPSPSPPVYSSTPSSNGDTASIENDMDTESSRIPWIPIDPYNPPPPNSTRYPYYRYAHPLMVTVNEGEMLYLPSGWFHHVSQECGEWADGSIAPCIAVNYWFDMDYEGEKYVMREMLGRLVKRVKGES